MPLNVHHAVVGGITAFTVVATIALGAPGLVPDDHPSGTSSEEAAPTRTGDAPAPGSASDLPFPLIPFEVETSWDVRSVSSEQHLTGDAGLPPDDAAIERAVTAVLTVVTAHLESLQAGGAGTLDATALPGLLDAADPLSLAAATTDLAGPTDPAVRVEVRLRVQHDGPPQWLRAVLVSERASGQVSGASLVFVPVGDQVALVGFGPNDAEAERAP